MKDTSYVGEMGLREVIFRLLYNWRKIIITALIFTVIMSGYKLITGMLNLSNDKLISNYEKEFNNTLAEYEMRKKALTSAVETLKESLESQIEYNNNSIRMQINHFDEQIGTISYYIDTDYKINPKLTYQDTDLSNAVIKSYLALAQQGDMYNYIMDNLSYDIDIKYLKELISTWDDTENHIISVQVVHKDSESCEELLKLIKDYFQLEKANITEKVGNHTLTQLHSSLQSYVDNELSEIQKSNRQAVADFELSLNNAESDLRNLQSPVYAKTNMNLIKQVIKFAVLGFVLGAFLSVCAIILIIMLSDKIFSIKDFKRCYNLSILGVLQSKQKKRIFGFIDRWLNQLEGNANLVDESVSIQSINSKINSYMKTAKIQGGSVVITGTTDYETIELVSKKMIEEMKGSYKLIAGGNVTYDAKTIELVDDCNAIVIIEKVGKSTFTEITKELENIINLDRKIIGVIIVAD